MFKDRTFHFTSESACTFEKEIYNLVLSIVKEAFPNETYTVKTPYEHLITVRGRTAIEKQILNIPEYIELTVDGSVIRISEGKIEILEGEMLIHEFETRLFSHPYMSGDDFTVPLPKDMKKAISAVYERLQFAGPDCVIHDDGGVITSYNFVDFMKLDITTGDVTITGLVEGYTLSACYSFGDRFFGIDCFNQAVQDRVVESVIKLLGG